jgi:PAB-dependent poly(A)-specific ribonuclease subunit 3
MYIYHDVLRLHRSPNVDFGHVVDSLNKLDSGTQEQILLMSRTQDSMLIASFADLKRSLNGAFTELSA